jgi:glycosyltransferase involved in cell wall biosynthesis
MASPLVTAVTPTWQRHELLLGRAVPSVAAQDYPALEHVVVSDGPDPVLREKLDGLPGVRFEELPEHDPAARWGHWARLHGADVAKGEYITYLDDDDSLGPNHAPVLAAALDAWPEAGFAYGRVIMHTEGTWCRIGTDPPGYGQITVMLMHRRELLGVATWRQGEPTIDWDLVSRWMDAGVGWVMAEADTAEIWPSRYR